MSTDITILKKKILLRTKKFLLMHAYTFSINILIKKILLILIFAFDL